MVIPAVAGMTAVINASEARKCRGKADRLLHEVRPRGAQATPACVSDVRKLFEK
jgi:hypothetical protein